MKIFYFLFIMGIIAILLFPFLVITFDWDNYIDTYHNIFDDLLKYMD
jgi:hypothetical protein